MEPFAISLFFVPVPRVRYQPQYLALQLARLFQAFAYLVEVLYCLQVAQPDGLQPGIRPVIPLNLKLLLQENLLVYRI